MHTERHQASKKFQRNPEMRLRAKLFVYFSVTLFGMTIARLLFNHYSIQMVGG